MTDMTYLCLHNATTIYSHLQPFDVHTRRKIVSIMCGSNALLSQSGVPFSPLGSSADSPHFPSLSKENSNSLGPSLTIAALQRLRGGKGCGKEGEGWCVDHIWLELQLVLDEWGLVDESAGFQGVKILLSHFAVNKNWSLHQVYSRLLRRMGVEFQVRFIFIFILYCY